ncbi:MAG: hypothetical protein FJ295_03490 [Planctomycetes bacterium]|nr:hypothetical protein [Planctomycetota bacterium]
MRTSHTRRAAGDQLFSGAGLLLLLCATNLQGCAGYQLGNRSLYRSDIRTVYLPVIESDSLRRNLGERLTEALIRDIELNTPYKVVATPDADSTLQCRLQDDRKRLLVETRTDEPRSLEWGTSVDVSWVDRQGQPLMQRSQYPVPGAALAVAQETSFVPEAGQSVVTAQQESMERLARQIRIAMQLWW